jgi:hypothetical protein
MPASYSGAEQAIRDRLVAGWTTTPITFQNETPADPFPPKDGNGDLAPWVNLEIMAGSSEIYGQGTPDNHPYLYTGLILVHVFVPVGTGTALAKTHADQIGELYRTAKFYDDVSPGCCVRSWAPHTDGGGTSDDDGNWFRVTMTCPFEYWHRG